MDRFIVTVDCFDRTVTNFRPIKRHVLHVLRHSSWKSSLLICLDTSPLESLDLLAFPPHFRTTGALEIKNWLSKSGEIVA